MSQGSDITFTDQASKLPVTGPARGKEVVVRINLPRQALLFCDQGRSYIVRASEPATEGGVLFSTDGKKFFELIVTKHKQDFIHDGRERGWAPERQGFDTSIEVLDPRHGTTNSIKWFWNRRDNLDEFDVDGNRFARAECPRQVEVEPLEGTLPLRYLYKGKWPTVFQTESGKSIAYLDSFGDNVLFSPHGSDSTRFFQVKDSGFNGGIDRHYFDIESPHHGVTTRVWKDTNTRLLGGEMIGKRRFIKEGDCNYDDRDKSFISAFDGEFVLDEAALAKHGLSADDVCKNTDGNIRVVCCVGRDGLILGGEVLKSIGYKPDISVVRLPEVRVPMYLYCLTATNTYLYASMDKYGNVGRHRWYDSLKLFVGPKDNLKEVLVDEAMSWTDGRFVIQSPEGNLITKPAKWKDQEITSLDPSQFRIVEDGDVVRLVELDLVAPEIDNIHTALSLKSAPKSVTELRDALGYIVDHRDELTSDVHFSLPSGVSDPIWNKIKSESVAQCGCGEIRMIQASKRSAPTSV